MQTRIEDLELSLNSIELLVKTLLKCIQKILIRVYHVLGMFCLLNFSN